MKILIVTPHFYPAVGGLESYVLSIVRGMQARGHDVVIVTSSDEYQDVTQDTFEGNTIYYLPVQMRLSNTPISLRWRRQLKEIFRSEAPDVINTHAPVPFMADVATFAAGRIPVVATYHAGSLLKGGGVIDLLLRAYERFVLPRVFHRARRIAAVYPTFVERIVGKTSGKVTFAPPGIDTEFFTPADVKKTTDLIFVGRIESTSTWKGIDVLLEAVRLVEPYHRNISLNIVGQGDAVEYYQEMARYLGIQKHINFTGLLRGEALLGALQASRVIVLPSKTEAESFGMVLAEAGSSGMPAIGSRIGGIPNVIDEGVTGLLAEPSDPQSLANAIRAMLDDPDMQREYGAAARKRIAGRYSQKHLLDTMETIFGATQHHPKYPKIVHVTAHYPPSLGGMEKVAENMAVQLAKRGQPIEVVTTNIGHDDLHKDIELPGYAVTRLRGYMIGGLPIAPMLSWRLVRQPRGTLYHAHIAQAGFPEATLFAAWIRRAKVIGHFHLDVEPSGAFGSIFRLYKRTVFPWMLRHLHAVIVFSKDQKQLVTHKYHVDPANVHIVPNGVGEEYFRSETRAPHRPFRLLFVGRLSPQKNLPLLLQALQGVSEKFETCIVGAGELSEKLRKLAHDYKLQNVRFVGRKDGRELLAIYDSADAFVLPSEREGMPLVLLEAMAMRLPIIGTDVLGTRDLIRHGKNGYLVPLDKPDEFQKALLTLASNPKTHAAMSDHASAVAAEFSWHKLIEQVLREVYP